MPRNRPLAVRLVHEYINILPRHWWHRSRPISRRTGKFSPSRMASSRPLSS